MPRSTCVDVLLKDEKLSYKSKNRRVPVFAYVLIMFVEIICFIDACLRLPTGLRQ